MRVAKPNMTQNRVFTPIHVKVPKMRAFAFALVTEALLLYALRSKTNPIFPSLVRNFQNQDLEPTQIFRRSIKKCSLSMLPTQHIVASGSNCEILWNHKPAVRHTESSIFRKPFWYKLQAAARHVNDRLERARRLISTRSERPLSAPSTIIHLKNRPVSPVPNHP